MVDRDLVEQARRGDREAFAVLVHQVSDSLYAVAHRILRDSGPRRGRAAERPRARLAPAPAPAGTRPLRGVDPSHPRPRLLRRIAAGSPTGRPTSGSCPSMGCRRRMAAPPSPTATSWSGRFAGSRSTSGRCSCCTTTSGCRSWRSPSCWRSPRARPDRDCTTPRAGSATALTAERGAPPSTEDVSHDRRSLARTRRSIVARDRPDPGA